MTLTAVRLVQKVADQRLCESQSLDILDLKGGGPFSSRSPRTLTMPFRIPLSDYSAAFKKAMRVAIATFQQAGRDLTDAPQTLIAVGAGQNRTEGEIIRRLLAGEATSTRISWQLVNFGRRLASHLEAKGFQTEADAIRRTGAEYVAAASPAAVERFLSIPDNGMQDLYFGFPKNIHDLRQFTTLSNAEPDIRRAHPDLSIPKRRQLYETWYVRNRQSFLSLFRVNSRGTHEPIAVSIILPLKPEARHRIAERSWNLDDVLDEIDGTATPRVVLVDTWIVKRVSHALKEDEATKREQHRRWAMVMIGHHLASFVERGRRVCVIVEPDFGHITALCDLFGFTPRRGGSLWELDLPSGRPAVDDRFFSFVEAAAHIGS
jgi:hypothetical protein